MMMYRKPRVAFLTGNGELQPIEMLDYARTLTENLYELKSVNLQENYRITPVDFDAIIIAKPTIKFEEKDKFKIDQYVMNGGKVIWLIDEVWADMDSLRNQQQMFMAYTQDLNLDDMLFNYGARINGDLIQDAQNDNPIPLVVGNLGNSPQTQLFPWMYFPVFISGSEHPIVRNLDPVSGFFANTIDTIRNPGIKKTILLTTSAYSRALLAPTRVHLGIIREQPDPSKFKQPNLATAVLLEGKFKSVFKGRIASSYLEIGDTVKELKYKEESAANKMIVISDGDVIRNELQAGGGIWPLGYYNITGQTFANKDFLLNAMEYLVDDSRLIESRGKDIKVRKLDMIKVKDEATKWRIINIGMPLLLIILFGITYNAIRRWRYAR
jgi:ABC-2 type transport system permease protein